MKCHVYFNNFTHMKALYQKIRSLAGKNYGLYKSLADRIWNFGDFSLEFLHIQGDPYAPASRVMIKASLQGLGYPSEWGGSFDRRLALSDYLLRKFSRNVVERYPDKDGAVALPMPGPEMVVRNSLWIDNGDLRACLQVRLPGDGRKIEAEAAAEILTMVLPDLVSASLYNAGARLPEGVSRELNEHYRVLSERTEILKGMGKLGLVAFIPDGAILPRASGLSDAPLEGAVPFKSPDELAVTMKVFDREIRGMGIPVGVTVITGGAFHGKSTLLQAISCAVHPHVPHDGREGIVVDETAMSIGVEDGRYVRGTDLSPLVRDLPFGVSTRNFCTLSASGSTSEAANLLEALTSGCRAFLIDEDSSAVNFLIRDYRVRELLGDKREPLIPLTDRIREICYLNCQQENRENLEENFNGTSKKSTRASRSFILVAGACGDFLDLADNIVVMTNYKAEYVRVSDRQNSEYFSNRIVKDLGSKEGGDNHDFQPLVSSICRNFAEYIKPIQNGIRPTSAIERQVKVKLNGDTLLQMGFLVSDTGKIKAFIDKSQRLGAGYILLNLCQFAVSNKVSESENLDIQKMTVMESIERICDRIKNVGFRNIPQGMSREMSLPRAVDIAFVLYRLHEKSLN